MTLSISLRSFSQAQETVPSSAPVIGAPQGTSTVFVPKGTAIVVYLNEGLSSYAASPGEELDYTVLHDVVVDGYLVAKAGDEAVGRVMEAQQGKTGFYGFGYKAADLRVAVTKVNNFCGDTISVVFVRTEFRQRQGLFGDKKDVGVTKDQKYETLVAHPQKICGIPTTETTLPIEGDVLKADRG